MQAADRRHLTTVTHRFGDRSVQVTTSVEWFSSLGSMQAYQVYEPGDFVFPR